jgi:hypothetical protein
VLQPSGTNVRRALTTSELRRTKPSRDEFLTQPRRPITVVLDGVTQNYNIGAIFRLCDAFLMQQLVICGMKVNLRKRRLVQAAQGTQHWVPWTERQHASDAVAEAKAMGAWIVVAEQTTASLRPAELVPKFPACLVLGGGATARSHSSGCLSFRATWRRPLTLRTSSTWSGASTFSLSQLFDVTRILPSGNRSMVKVTLSEVASFSRTRSSRKGPSYTCIWFWKSAQNSRGFVLPCRNSATATADTRRELLTE